MDMKLEVLVLPVSDVDRAKRFYEELGFRLDIDYAAPDGNYRIIQFTPPGSQASIIFGKGVTSTKPGSIDRLLMAVSDIEAARNELVSKGAQVEMFHDAGGGLGAGFYAAKEKWAPGPDPERRSYASYASFSDPDGNVWLLQEIKERLPGRVTINEAVNGKLTDILLDTLKTTAAAHGVHEKEIGKPDPDWPQWYAAHMARTLGTAGYQLTGPSA
jgi:catechol 2,3-dioxygenase-like lactoylglutathione lyase family enzyme